MIVKRNHLREKPRHWLVAGLRVTEKLSRCLTSYRKLALHGTDASCIFPNRPSGRAGHPVRESNSSHDLGLSSGSEVRNQSEFAPGVMVPQGSQSRGKTRRQMAHIDRQGVLGTFIVAE